MSAPPFELEKTNAPPAYSDVPHQFAPPQPTFIQPIIQAPVPQTTVVVNTQSTDQPRILGYCPACRVGKLTGHYTCCGLCCAFLLFPIGILCCCHWKQKRCKNCSWRSG